MTVGVSARKSGILRLTAIGVGLALFLSGCGSMDFPGGSFGGQPKASYLEGASSGSRYESFLVWTDRREIDTAAWAATHALKPHSEIAWANAETGSSGSVRSGVVYLVGFNAGAEVEAPVGLDTSVLLEPVAGNYVTNANANIRLAPRTDGDKATLLTRGNRVKVIAREPIDGWYLVASGKRVVGYIYGDLLDKVGGGDTLLAGGAAQYPKICRELTYKVRFSAGKSDEWLNGVCREGRKKWAIVGGRSLQAAE